MEASSFTFQAVLAVLTAALAEDASLNVITADAAELPVDADEGCEEEDADDVDKKKDALTWKMSPYCEKSALR